MFEIWEIIMLKHYEIVFLIPPNQTQLGQLSYNKIELSSTISYVKTYVSEERYTEIDETKLTQKEIKYPNAHEAY